MNFVNPLLFGAFALAIPIIIHLFHKSRFQIVKWGAMHLLEAVIRTNQRRIQIEQIILLIIRAAIPALLALCMARPLWKGVQKLLGRVAKPRPSSCSITATRWRPAARASAIFPSRAMKPARVLNELKQRLRRAGGSDGRRRLAAAR